MKTAFTDLVGVPYPIVGFNRSPGVVAAVSNAGGFGVLAASAYTPEELDAQLTWIEEQTAGKPYGARAGHEGALRLESFYVGQVVGSFEQIRPAAEITRQIVADCERRIRDLAGLIDAGLTGGAAS